MTAPAPAALSVRCPICDAHPGEPCENVIGGWLRARQTPRLYRLVVAREEAASDGR